MIYLSTRNAVRPHPYTAWSHDLSCDFFVQPIQPSSSKKWEFYNYVGNGAQCDCLQFPSFRILFEVLLRMIYYPNFLKRESVSGPPNMLVKVHTKFHVFKKFVQTMEPLKVQNLSGLLQRHRYGSDFVWTWYLTSNFGHSSSWESSVLPGPLLSSSTSVKILIFAFPLCHTVFKLTTALAKSNFSCTSSL